jgi:hypothetical protein
MILIYGALLGVGRLERGKGKDAYRLTALASSYYASKLQKALRYQCPSRPNINSVY